MSYKHLTREQLLIELEKIKKENEFIKGQSESGLSNGTVKNSLLKEVEYYRILNQFTSNLLNIHSLDEIYHYITTTLHNLCQNTIVLFVSIDELNFDTKLEVIVGLDQTLFSKILNFAGFNPVGKKFKLVSKMNDYFRKGTFTEFNGGLVDFSSNEFPPLIAKYCQKIVGIHKIYTIGIKKEDNLLAAIHFFTFNNQSIDDGSFIETIVKQSAIVIQKKKAEFELIESEEKFRSLVESSNDGIALMSLDGIIQFVNKRKCEIYGADDEKQLIGMNAFDLITKNDRTIFSTRQEEFQSKGIVKIPEAEMLRLDGTTFYAEVVCNMVKNANQKPTWIMITTRDITDRIISEKELEQTKRTYLNLINTIDEAIFIQDESEKFISVNLGASRLYNCERDNLIGKTLHSLSAEGLNNFDEITKLSNNVKLTGKPARFEFWAIRNNNEIFPKDIIVNKGKYFGKEVLIFTARDITDRINIEKRLRESNLAKDKFFSIIAHDLKNPIGSYREIAKLLYDEYDIFDDNERKDFLKLIKESSIQLYELLENLLIWSRSQKEQIKINPESFNLYEMTTNIINVIAYSAQNKNIEIINNLPEKLFVYGDENMMVTVVNNLLTNAIKFTYPNGKIEIGVAYDEKNKEITNNENSINLDNITIFIRDNGVGIDEEIKGKLFKIDETVSTLGTIGEKGTGLGLVLCMEFLEKQGGKIWVESEVENGSTFFFTIPMSKNIFMELNEVR